LVEQALKKTTAPVGHRELGAAFCAYMQGNYSQAAAWIQKVRMQSNVIYHLIAAAIYGQSGDTAAAAREREWILANAPSLLDEHLATAMQIKEPMDQKHFRDGLARAHLVPPEG
jgi:hypothetical protein